MRCSSSLTFRSTLTGDFHLAVDGSSVAEASVIVHAHCGWTEDDRGNPAVVADDLSVTIDDRELAEHGRPLDRSGLLLLLGGRGVRQLERETCIRAIEA